MAEARLRAAVLLGACLWLWVGGVGLGPGPVEPAPPPPDVDGVAGLLWGRPIDLQRADAETLQVLPGIGPARSSAIVQARCRRPFRRLADVDRVPGIGPRTLAGLAGWAEVRDPRPAGCEARREPAPERRAPAVDAPDGLRGPRGPREPSGLNGFEEGA
ncbi:MAG: ComEA family DNA-binding protein [Myxococcota bacterium]